MSMDSDWIHNAFPVAGRMAASNQRMEEVSMRLQERLNFNSDSDDGSSDASGVIVAAPMDTGEEKITGQWEYESFDDENWEMIEEEPTDDPDYCFLCSCTQTDAELEGNPQLARFNAYLAENYSKMTRMKLAIQGQSIYNTVLRKRTKDKKPMRCKTIIDHLEKHAPTARLQLEHQVRMLQCSSMELSGQLKQRDHGSKDKKKTRMDKVNLNQYLKVTTQLNVIQEKLSKMGGKK